MNRREAILSALGIFAVALVARVFFAAQIVFPKPEDTAYYVAVARNLLNGRGLVFDALWSYGTPPLEVPARRSRCGCRCRRSSPRSRWRSPARPSWQPRSRRSSSGRSSRCSHGGWPPMSAQELELPVGRARTLAVGAGLTTAVYLPLLLHSSLPDSTMVFTALALVACLLMTRILRSTDRPGIVNPRLLALGLVIGLAALTRNEAIWLGVVWAGLVWFTGDRPMADRVRLIGVVAVVAVIVFAPWAVRNWQAFGSPLPSQTATNALSITGLDIFAWNDPPTLQRYLAVGWQQLLEMRVTGFLHNLLNVLLLLGLPISILGVISIPLVWPSRSLRPLAWYSLITFLFTCLVFPVSTTWGTFLHAAGPVHVWLVIGALLLLDAVIARVGQMRGWTRPVAWLGPALAIFGSVLFSLVLLGTFGRGSIETRDYYAQLGARMAEAGHPLDESAGPGHLGLPDLAGGHAGRAGAGTPRRAAGGRVRSRAGIPRHALRGPLRGRRPRALAGGHRRRRTVERVLPRDRHRHGADARVRDRLPVKPDPYTRTRMDAVQRGGGGGRREEAERARLAREVHDGPAGCRMRSSRWSTSSGSSSPIRAGAECAPARHAPRSSGGARGRQQLARRCSTSRAQRLDPRRGGAHADADRAAHRHRARADPTPERRTATVVCAWCRRHAECPQARRGVERLRGHADRGRRLGCGGDRRWAWIRSVRSRRRAPELRVAVHAGASRAHRGQIGRAIPARRRYRRAVGDPDSGLNSKDRRAYERDGLPGPERRRGGPDRRNIGESRESSSSTTMPSSGSGSRTSSGASPTSRSSARRTICGARSIGPSRRHRTSS